VTDFPHVLDSTLISTFRSCPAKARMSYLEHWKPGEESVHLVAGKAFASGLEAARLAFYVQGRSADESLCEGLAALFREYGQFQCPEDSPKGPLRMAGALEFYFSRYPLGSDGATPHMFGSTKRGIEFSFLEPLPINHPVTGDPLLFSGRADMVADAFGGLFLYDEKTTSRLGPTWPKQWDMRSQFTAYCWGLRGHGYRPTGVVVRGVSILKDSYDTLQAVTYRSDWEVERWLAQTVRDAQRMIEMWRSGEWDYSLDHACTEYGGCAFTRICKSPEPEKWLPLYFRQRKWDPVSRIETAL